MDDGAHTHLFSAQTKRNIQKYIVHSVDIENTPPSILGLSGHFMRMERIKNNAYGSHTLYNKRNFSFRTVITVKKHLTIPLNISIVGWCCWCCFSLLAESNFVVFAQYDFHLTKQCFHRAVHEPFYIDASIASRWHSVIKYDTFHHNVANTRVV